jgi:glycosyltransferase involved in cell wall biosynthesis
MPIPMKSNGLTKLTNLMPSPIFDEVSLGKVGCTSEPDSQEFQHTSSNRRELSEILMVTSFPPRECGIATYSHDLIFALHNKFGNSISVKVCALETDKVSFDYSKEVIYTLNTSDDKRFDELAFFINQNSSIGIVMIQHEFGFYVGHEQAFIRFLQLIQKPVVLVFHSVLPHPDPLLKSNVQAIANACESIIVMTNSSAAILVEDYHVPRHKTNVIAHGTHLVQHLNVDSLKKKYDLNDRKVITTFGLLSAGKGIETTLDALPEIIKYVPDIVFLIIGKTHPEVVRNDGEVYRQMLEDKVTELGLKHYVRFINRYLSLSDLLEYLQLTDVYLFTTNDPNQAVSGTFVYAMSCACPIISTPIPHAIEILNNDNGMIIDFQNSQKLAQGVIHLMSNDSLRLHFSTNTLQKIIPSAWENSAILHGLLFEKMTNRHIQLNYHIPAINLLHFRRMTTGKGIIQFAKINQPDYSSGYTLDDNARALIAMCMNYELTGNQVCVGYIRTFINFIDFCLQPDGTFLNYVDIQMQFTVQNSTSGLDDANGRAIWALGYVVSLKYLLPLDIVSTAECIIQKNFSHLKLINSTRAMAFAIKGLYYYNKGCQLPENIEMTQTLANRLVQMYKHEASYKWEWFEGYLTYANSILAESLLYAWLLTHVLDYKIIAIKSLDFLLSKIFNENGIEVISNNGWLQRGQSANHYGEQPIDVAYTVMTLSCFYDLTKNEEYAKKMRTAFSWFLGNNRLHQIVYNPCTGGCYDGLEQAHVNLNQGAESTVSYLMARLTIEKYKK